MSIVELSVEMDSHGCEKRVRKAIKKLDGVDEVEIDMDMQKETVMGYIDQGEVLEAVRKTGRKAEFWLYSYDGEYNNPFALQYRKDSTNSSSYNYYPHGYNSTVCGYFPDPISAVIDDHAIELFSDENVNACVIM